MKEKGQINLPKTAANVEEKLVPLKATPVKSPRWAGSQGTPDYLGDGKYGEIVYQSPIKTSAGDVHFSNRDTAYPTKAGDVFPNYFSNIRYEDMADGKTRKILETQSDLFQKGNIEREISEQVKDLKVKYEGNDIWSVIDKKENVLQEFGGKKPEGGYYGANEARKQAERFIAQQTESKNKIVNLQPYSSNDPLAHLRTFREEVKRAAKDGKDTLLIPSGETAMKIEGLGQINRWLSFPNARPLQIENMKVGMEIAQPQQVGVGKWIITDVLGDGKFKAVQKRIVDSLDPKAWNYIDDITTGGKKVVIARNAQTGERLTYNSLKEAKADIDIPWQKKLEPGDTETFDISGKIDTQHFVYKLNEEAIPREARKMGLIVEGKGSVDSKGNIIPGSGLEGKGDWWFIRIPKERAKFPVEAFGVTPLLLTEQENE